MSLAFRLLTRNFHSGKKGALMVPDGLSGYHELLMSSDIEKVKRIAKVFLPEEVSRSFVSDHTDVSHELLINLMRKVEVHTTLPVRSIKSGYEQESSYFDSNRTFINLPYSKVVRSWPDRSMLQKFVQEHFHRLFKPRDLVIVPGCADGQMAIEIKAQAIGNAMNLDIVAGDLNDVAMKLGYCTMKSYGIPQGGVHWVRADITSSLFFDWLMQFFPFHDREQVVTLVQPALTEQSFLSFLQKNAEFARTRKFPSLLIMPILLEDSKTGWYKSLDADVQRATFIAEKTQTPPQLLWHETKFGRELLGRDAISQLYVPKQYLIREETIPDLQKTAGYVDVAAKVLDFSSSSAKGFSLSSQLRTQDKSKRMLCIWEASAKA